MIIYGAGSAGIQLASALKQSSEAKAVAFVDDNSHLHGLMIAGLPVYSPKILTALIRKLVTKWVDGYHQPEREAEIA